MASLIKGITVILHEKTVAGVDAFNAPVYTETPVTVENVLVSPVTSIAGEIVDDLQLNGRKEAYMLSIPKKNVNTWESVTVEFWGKKWKTVGPVHQLITENVPLDWDREVKVERYA